eukprot:12362418-Alexandrium_andersonii.AAC.1
MPGLVHRDCLNAQGGQATLHQGAGQSTQRAHHIGCQNLRLFPKRAARVAACMLAPAWAPSWRCPRRPF